ncbi:MAG: hypothetical protein V3V99_07185 [candidate division Zixibacteria bacterium]
MFSKSLYSLTIILILITSHPALGRMLYSVEEADSGLTSNSYIEILHHEDILWMGGGRGLSYSPDGGLSWFTYNAQTGLNSDEPSAIFGRPGQLWVATSHTEPYQGVNYPFGDGFNLTYDNGQNWESMAPYEASGFGRICYDLVGNEKSTYAACFHGGLIVSHNSGQDWSHMFLSSVDSADWAADNWADLVSGRYYACFVDTLHADTMVVYGGTAKGIQKFLYIPKRVKQGGNNITAIAGNNDFIYVAHENGVSQADSALNIFHTSGLDTGLPSHWIREMFVFGNKVWVAPFDPVDMSGLGLYYVDNADQLWSVFDDSLTGPGDFWTKHSATYFEGDGAGIYDFKNFNDSILYIAAGDSGVFHSVDSGSTWERFYIDSSDMSFTSRRNQVLSIDVTEDSVFLGTRAGLVKASYVPPFTFDFDTLITFEENDSTGSVVSIVRHHYVTDSAGDYSFKWIAVEPIDPGSGSGNYAAIQIFDQTDNALHILFSDNPPTIINDIAVSDSFTTFATSTGLSGNYNINLTEINSFAFVTNDNSTGQTLVSYKFQTADWVGNRLFAGSTGGFGYRIDNTSWRVFRANTDSLKHDLAVVRTRANTSLPGDWVVVLDQQITGTDTVLWAACRGITDSVQQYNSVAYSVDFGDSWTRVLTNEMIWNFAFDQNGGAYAAASSGLYFAPNSRDEWHKAEIIDPFTKDTIWAETEIYSVEVVDSILWIGTSFGIAYRPIENVDNWSIIRVFKSTDAAADVFAAPVPFSPLNPNGRLTIHYRVEQSAYITVEIYDFAMNLVAVPSENRYREGGEDYFETWDGYNQSGEVVATGMYFFKVSYSAGQEYWGRLAIIP